MLFSASCWSSYLLKGICFDFLCLWGSWARKGSASLFLDSGSFISIIQLFQVAFFSICKCVLEQLRLLFFRRFEKHLFGQELRFVKSLPILTFHNFFLFVVSVWMFLAHKLFVSKFDLFLLHWFFHELDRSFQFIRLDEPHPVFIDINIWQCRYFWSDYWSFCSNKKSCFLFPFDLNWSSILNERWLCC